jgi:hypothetical protein
VPGLSPDILAGGERTLSRPDVRELHIEISDSSSRGRRVVEQLAGWGLTMEERSAHGSADLTFVRRRG